MDVILDTLRTSVDNDSRKAAAAQLRLVQESHANEFLEYTFQCISSPACPADQRFFAATTVLAFVEESWRSAVNKEAQLTWVQRYVALVLDGLGWPPLLIRKLATIVATMARRGLARAQPGQLPPLLDTVASAYTQWLGQHCLTPGGALSPESRAALPHILLLVHVLLKEIHRQRVGDAFELLCRGMVTPLSAVFTALASCAPLENYDAYLFLYKSALRVFGYGVFAPDFYRFLLEETWRLAEGLSPTEAPVEHDKRARLVDYGLKIHERSITTFPTRLQELGEHFFLPRDVPSGGVDHGLFSLAAAVVAASTTAPDGRALLAEKTVCRAMRLLTFFVSAEDGDAFVSACVAALGRSTFMPALLRDVVTGYLADDCSTAAQREWRADPERVAADLDVDFDDDAAVSCAEQLFLALTGSTAAAAVVLPVAWHIVNDLLTNGTDARAITAALHAVGIGYGTMSEGTTPDDFLAFLRGRLLPLVATTCAAVPPTENLPTSPAAAPSPFVLRRVVWLMGMWCESVTDPAARAEAQAALATLLQTFPDDVVLLLTTLRAVENYVTDDHFTPGELPEPSARVVVAAVRQVLTHLRAPSTVRQMSCLVTSLVGKSAVPASGAFLLDVFAPAAVTLIARCEHEAGSAALTDGGEDDGDTEDGAQSHGSVLPHLLETLSGIVSVCGRAGEGSAATWHLYEPVVVACTRPGHVATPWAEDSAWELLLAMARSSACVGGAGAPVSDASLVYATAAEALRWALMNSERDFESLPIAVRAASALVLLLEEGWDGLGGAHEGGLTPYPVTAEDAARLLRLMTESSREELVSACLALLLVLARARMALVGPLVVHHCVAALTRTADVQSEPYAVAVAVLLAWTVRADATQTLFHTFLEAAAAPGSALLESLVLVLDVCPNTLATMTIAWLLAQAQAAVAMEADMASMVRHAVETASAPPDPSDDGDTEARLREELLLEMIGDEDVTAAMPHMRRLVRFYAPLLGG